MKASKFGRFHNYSLQAFQKDLLSGLMVGIVAIPLGMAFAIASGVKPEYGLYTTVIAGILISLFGGSRFQIGGPTGAFIPILLAIVLQYGYENLLIAGFMAGIMLLLMGLFKLGGVIKFIPRPVTIGFTAGIAVTIFSGQIANFLGLTGLTRQQSFMAEMKEIGLQLSTVNGFSVLTALICLVILIALPKRFPKLPASLLGLLVSTLAAAFFYPGQVETIGSTYGTISSSLPAFRFPSITVEHLQTLLKPAFAIAMLGGIESLLSAVVADGMTGTRHNSNRELIGQGIANIITPLFGGIPATGAIARTATNIKSGAVSPVSGIIHGIVVLLVLVLFAPYASMIPLASMAPVLMMVAWNMSERKAFAHVLRTRTADALVLVITFVLTVFADLTIAVQIGLLLSGVLFVKHMSTLLVTRKVLPDPSDKNARVSADMVSEHRNCPQISMYTVDGALFFGVARMFEEAIMKEIHYKPTVLIIKMDSVLYMDTTGEANFASIVKHFQKTGGTVIISEIQDQPRNVLCKTGLDRMIGQDRFFETTGEAIQYALSRLNKNQCAGCRQFAFRECDELSGHAEADFRHGREHLMPRKQKLPGVNG